MNSCMQMIYWFRFNFRKSRQRRGADNWLRWAFVACRRYWACEHVCANTHACVWCGRHGGVLRRDTCSRQDFTTLGEAGLPGDPHSSQTVTGPEGTPPHCCFRPRVFTRPDTGPGLILELGEYFRKQSRHATALRSSAVKICFENANLFQSNWSLLEKQVGPNGSSVFVYAKIACWKEKGEVSAENCTRVKTRP